MVVTPNVQLGNVGAIIGLEQAGEHADESGLAGAVLAQHDDNLRVAEGAALAVSSPDYSSEHGP